MPVRAAGREPAPRSAGSSSWRSVTGRSGARAAPPGRRPGSANSGGACPPLADLAAAGFRLVLTHGGGLPGDEPVPGVPAARPGSPSALDVRRAETQGAAGYLIQQVLGNLCRNRNVEVPIAVVVTRVRVDPDDPAFRRPTSPVGAAYSAAQARRLGRERGWAFAGSAARGLRRVVPSPRPGASSRPTRSGGWRTPGSSSSRQEAAGSRSSRRPSAIAASRPCSRRTRRRRSSRPRSRRTTWSSSPGSTGWRWGIGTRSIGIERLSVAEARALLAAGEFPPGSMGPKIEAAIAFVGGRPAARRSSRRSPASAPRSTAAPGRASGRATAAVTPGVTRRGASP